MRGLAGLAFLVLPFVLVVLVMGCLVWDWQRASSAGRPRSTVFKCASIGAGVLLIAATLRLTAAALD